MITTLLPRGSALAYVREDESTKLALWRDGSFYDLTATGNTDLHNLDALLRRSRAEIRSLLDDPGLQSLPSLDPTSLQLLAPVQTQEVWASGVTYLRSREARVEEAVTKDIYTLVYEAERPELFFKAAGWRVVEPGGEIGIRADSGWDVPEPELAVLANAGGEIVAYACGNDMSSRSIEGENPLYLPQAKVYDASCSIGPVAVLAWSVDPVGLRIALTISRNSTEIFSASASVDDMVRDPTELVGVLYGAYSLPTGAWLLTGTPIVPDPYTAEPGDIIQIRIDGIGELQNTVKRIVQRGALARPHLSGRTSA